MESMVSERFHIGQKVKPRPDAPLHKAEDYPLAEFPGPDTAYTIRAINIWPRVTLLRFHELDNSALAGVYGGHIEPGFNEAFFEEVL